MSKCPEITGLTFSASGQRAIEAIRAKQELANVLAGIMAVAPLVEIFGGKGGLHTPFGVGWNIAKNDWAEWAQTLAAIPVVTRNRIRQIAADEYFISSGKERDFWYAVIYSCGN